MKRILFTGGGTGGHIYPALSIAKEVKRRYPDVRIAYIGTGNGLESKIVPKENDIEFHTINIQGFKRKISIANVQTIIKFIQSVGESKKILKSFRPEIVVGTGGYVSGPPVYSAYRIGIPTFIHEQNVVPGLTTKFLSRFTSKVAVSFKLSEQYFKKDCDIVYTGNPRATDVTRASASKGKKALRISGENKKLILFVGGSQGARVINEAVLKMLPYLGQLPDAHFVYITGESHYNRIIQKIPLDKYRNLEVHPFLYNLPDVLAATNLVISRAGASTIAELTSLGVPSILIPSPYVTNNHQVRNAQWLEVKGACKMIEEKECTGPVLWAAICDLIKNHEKNKTMSYCSRALGLPQSAELIVNELEKLIEMGDRHTIA